MIKKISFAALSLVFLFGSVVYAYSPTDSNGIYLSTYTYDYSLKTFNAQSESPRWIANVTFGNTVGLDTNETVPTSLWIENNHSTNTYAAYFSIGYNKNYVALDDIYYRSDSDIQPTIYEQKQYQSDGTIDSLIKFGDAQLGQGLLDPDERIRAYIDWTYKGSPDDAYWWFPEYELLNTKYHWLAGLAVGSTDYFSGLVPEVGNKDDVQLLGSGVNTSRLNSAADSDNINHADFAEWKKIQQLKKEGKITPAPRKITILDANGKVVLETDSNYYKQNKETIEQELNLK
ncbi:MAG: hypothetical protein K0Q90_1805 [Paenibacillaceae bacterium]|nr:hypothetical protein [Paenibacillaceae bacterium]